MECSCAPRNRPMQACAIWTTVSKLRLACCPKVSYVDVAIDAAKLPKWRYRLRQWLIPIVRAETPYLAFIQDKLRTPALDQYFALTANLGTHTFFMIMLPILFWCGYATFARA